MANNLVHSLAWLMASCSFVFHISATSLANGSSGLGLLSNAWIDSRTVLICNAGDHMSFSMSRQILPSLSMFGWKMRVRKRTLGATSGQFSGRNSSSLKMPPSQGEPGGPAITTWKQRQLASSGVALMPGGGSLDRLRVSTMILRVFASVIAALALGRSRGGCTKMDGELALLVVPARQMSNNS